MTVTATPWSVDVGSVVSRGEARLTAIDHTVTGCCWRHWSRGMADFQVFLRFLMSHFTQCFQGKRHRLNTLNLEIENPKGSRNVHQHGGTNRKVHTWPHVTGCSENRDPSKIWYEMVLRPQVWST